MPLAQLNFKHRHVALAQPIDEHQPIADPPAAEAQPTDTQAAQAQPTDPPAAEAQQIDETPAAEAQPTETPEAEDQPAEPSLAEYLPLEPPSAVGLRLSDLENPVVKLIMAHNSMMTSALKALQEEVAELRAVVAGKRTTPKRSPQFVVMEGGDEVLIGSISEAIHLINKHDYLSVWDNVDNAKDFIVKLLPKVFADEELARSNFNGGHVFNGKDHIEKDALRKKTPFLAIMAQADIEFPGFMSSALMQKQIRDAVNGKCRKISMKLKV